MASGGPAVVPSLSPHTVTAISASPVTPIGSESRETHEMETDDNPLHTANAVPPHIMNTIIDIYTVDESGKPKQAAMSAPFQMVVSLAGPQGE